MRRFLVLAACVLLLSGCVWTRLLSMKGQFKEFDRYFTAVDVGPALLLEFKEPCVRPADWGFLLGDEIPTAFSAATSTGPETWTWRLRRDRADSIGLEITVLAKDGLTTALLVPPEVLRFLPRERLLAIVRAFGSAEIDRDKREASAGLIGADNQPINPGRATIIAALGEPDAVAARDGGIEHMTYRFLLQKPDGSLGRTSTILIDMKGDQMTSLSLEAPRFKAAMRLDANGKAP